MKTWTRREISQSYFHGDDPSDVFVRAEDVIKLLNDFYLGKPPKYLIDELSQSSPEEYDKCAFTECDNDIEKGSKYCLRHESYKSQSSPRILEDMKPSLRTREEKVGHDDSCKDDEVSNDENISDSLQDSNKLKLVECPYCHCEVEANDVENCATKRAIEQGDSLQDSIKCVMPKDEFLRLEKEIKDKTLQDSND